MDTDQFTTIFLPSLALEYAKGNLPFHGLVDFDTWKKVFPDNEPQSPNQIQWSQVEFTCNILQDKSLLLSFILPQPTRYGGVKYAAIRINLEDRYDRPVVYYVLTKPQSRDDPWDILYMPLPLGEEKMELKFKQKITGTANLRNFVLDVQQIDFTDDSYNKSFIDDFKRMFGVMFKQQE